MLDAFAASGLTRVEFARKHGIGVHRLRYWEQRLHHEVPEESSASIAPSSDFVPVEFSVDRAQHEAPRSPILVTTPTGWRVEVTLNSDLALFESVVRAIDGGCS